MKRIILSGVLLATLLASATHAEPPTQLKPFERGSWQQILKAHHGRATLVHFWGVTCGPCKVELPLLGQFMKQHGDVDVVTISADLAPNLPAATQTMLKSAGLDGAENWIFNDGYVERLRFEIDPTWQGDIPRTILISPDTTAATIEGTAEIPDLETWAARQKRAAR